MGKSSQKVAFGAPGRTPHWAPGDKDGVGTAFGYASPVWFTTWRGALTEVYYPTVDHPQTRDLRFLISDGESVWDETRDLACKVCRIENSQGYAVKRASKDERFTLEKEIICDTEQPCIIQRNRFSGDLKNLKCYAVCHTRMDGAGWGNNGQALFSGDRRVLCAHRNDCWLALASEPGFERISVGFFGASDGVTDIREHRRMAWEFDQAKNGNVVLTGEIDVKANPEFTIVLGFGETLHSAVTAMLHSLSVPYLEKRNCFVQGWKHSSDGRRDVSDVAGDQGALYRSSCDVLVTHRDKTYLGGIIAALAIPFGEVRADSDGRGGYHLVWPRDMVNCATSLLAVGDRRTPLQSLIYLAVAQREDGSFAQNFWMNGKPCWSGLQLDEVTYPILLAYRLRQHQALDAFDPLRMVLKAAEYILDQGPITPQERWEQMSGYSPCTFAIVIASLICAASFAEEAGKKEAAEFLREYADYLYLHLDDWTVTNRGDLHPTIKRYFVRINPAKPGDGMQRSPDDAVLTIPDHPAGAQNEFPARNIVDAGFLDLVRYGILAPDNPLVVDSLKVVDHVLKVDTPEGPCWRRFNHDGYGQRDDGSPFDEWGKGRAWPLLTGERGLYELAAGGDAKLYLHTMEKLATQTGLLAEQVWDEPKDFDGQQVFGKPTGSAVPLAWAHAEYIKLTLSIQAGRMITLIPEVADRYLGANRPQSAPEMWTFHYPASTMRAGRKLRVYARRSFRLRYSLDNWGTALDADATSTELDISYVDVDVPKDQSLPVRFTFHWLDDQTWEGCDYSVAMA